MPTPTTYTGGLVIFVSGSSNNWQFDYGNWRVTRELVINVTVKRVRTATKRVWTATKREWADTRTVVGRMADGVNYSKRPTTEHRLPQNRLSGTSTGALSSVISVSSSSSMRSVWRPSVFSCLCRSTRPVGRVYSLKTSKSINAAAARWRWGGG